VAQLFYVRQLLIYEKTYSTFLLSSLFLFGLLKESSASGLILSKLARILCGMKATEAQMFLHVDRRNGDSLEGDSCRSHRKGWKT